jgi:hypothetical protein
LLLARHDELHGVAGDEPGQREVEGDRQPGGDQVEAEFSQ